MLQIGIIAVLLAGLLSSGAAGAQPPPVAAKQTLAQAERLAVDLKPGMSLQEVRGLLGKPRRTALKPGRTSEPAHDTLHWTYAWPGPHYSDWVLQVVFASGKAPEGWVVQSWDWSGN